MAEIFGIPTVAFFGQIMLGLVNGAFYALLSLGVAVIFGVLRIANFAHGAQYMLGAVAGWALLNLPQWAPGLGLPQISYWWGLLIVPLLCSLFGAAQEWLFIRRVYHIDHAYGLLLTIGLSMIIEAVVQLTFGLSARPFPVPADLTGSINLGFMTLPTYRGWVLLVSLVVCFGTWLAIERTRLGAMLRAATENPTMVQAFGVNVPLLLMLTYAFGTALAGFAGIMAAPIYPVNPTFGHNILIVVFAVVVIGGMGSIFGAIVSGYLLGMIEGLTRVFWPEAASTVIFIVMAIVLLVRPAGLFGRS